MRRNDSTRTGLLLARTLRASWRSLPFPRLEISESDLDELTPLLCASGAAGLAWRRVEQSHLKDSSSAEVLHHAARLLSLQAAMHEEKVAKVFRLLNEASVQAILVKGWAAAGLYSSRDLRPSGDIDIAVSRAQSHRAKEILHGPDASDCWVDLHTSFDEFPERSFDDLFARSKTVSLGETTITTLGAEDHLALLCIHFLKHGAWRPLWLCDISAAIECLPAGFDWSVCLGAKKTRAGWIECALVLAERLLGADLDRVPASTRAKELPHWLVDNVLQQWATPFAVNQPPMNHPEPMSQLLRHPSGLVEGLGKRWPNPILATVSVDGSFNQLPRFPYQVANLISRAGQFLIQGFRTRQED